MPEKLPVAEKSDVRRYALALLRERPRPLLRMLGLHGMAAASGLVGPWLLGDLVENLRRGATDVAIDRVAVGLAAFVVVQAVITRYAMLASARFGESLLANLREDFVDQVLGLPLSMVERAGTGELVTRSSRDVALLSVAARLAAPEILIGLVTVGLMMGALVLVSPVLALLGGVGMPVVVASTRWYLRRATPVYLRKEAAWAKVAQGLAETAEGASTIEALRLTPRRLARTDADCAESYRREKTALRLRTIYWPLVNSAHVLPVVALLLVGGYFHLHGWVTLGQVTAATLYLRQITDPLNRILSRLDELQVGGAAMARILGVARVPTDRREGPARPSDGGVLAADDVRYAYVGSRDVLHGVSLRVVPGERLAVVGPSGAGKSTLGRLLAGIHPPRAGTVRLGGASLVELPLDELRGHVALVTQEHHVFVGTIRENVTLARPGASDAEVRSAMAAVGALDWATALPDGLHTSVGSGGTVLSPAQAQQLALARLLLADPHTLVLDEATSLLDPRAARRLERSLTAVLRGRTVIAIAHRLHTAHDADRVAVVADGRIAELGSHHDLVDAAGPYAALWSSWHGRPPS